MGKNQRKVWQQQDIWAIFVVIFFFKRLKIILGLSPKNDWQRAKLDEIADLQKELAQELSVYVGTALGIREGNKVNKLIQYIPFQSSIRKEVYQPTISRIFPIYVKQLKESGSGFMIESGPTWIDFFIEGLF